MYEIDATEMLRDRPCIECDQPVDHEDPENDFCRRCQGESDQGDAEYERWRDEQDA